MRDQASIPCWGTKLWTYCNNFIFFVNLTCSMLWSTRCHYSTQFQDRQNDSDTHNGLVCEKTHNISFPQPSFVQSAGQWVHFLQEWTICNFLSCDIIYLLNTFLNILIKLHVKGSQIFLQRGNTICLKLWRYTVLCDIGQWQAI